MCREMQHGGKRRRVKPGAAREDVGGGGVGGVEGRGREGHQSRLGDTQ